MAPISVARVECENGSYQCRLGSSVRVTPISVARVEFGGESAPSVSMRPRNADVGGTNQMNHWDAAVLCRTKLEPHVILLSLKYCGPEEDRPYLNQLPWAGLRSTSVYKKVGYLLSVFGMGLCAYALKRRETCIAYIAIGT